MEWGIKLKDASSLPLIGGVHEDVAKLFEASLQVF